MKSLPLLTTAIAGSIIFMTPTLNAAVIQVDLSANDTSPGAAWNTIAGDISDAALLDTSESATGITLTASGWSSSSNTANNTNQAGAFDAAFGLAADDNFNVGSGTATITLSGIAAGSYIFEIASSRSSAGSGNRLADITVGNNFADTTPNGDDFNANSDGFVDGSLLVWNSITANGADDVVIQITAGSGDFGYINAFTISPVPEPSSTALLGLCGIALILRRRRS